MQALPAISIVLPTRNGARYLADSIESCLGQTYRNLELIVVDDCSTDATPQIIASHHEADARLRSIRNAENRKLPGSLNLGFREARGHYLTWTSDDNLYKPRALEVMAKYLDDHPVVDFVYTGFDHIDEDGRYIRSARVGPPSELTVGNCVGACFLYRRRVMESLGDYDESSFLAEDYDYWFRAFIRFRLERIEESLYLYRLHPASLTSQHGEDVWPVAQRVIERNLDELCRVKPEFGLAARLQLAERAMRARNLPTARRHLAAALRSHPLATWRTLPSKRLALATVFGVEVTDRIRQAWSRVRVWPERRDVRRARPSCGAEERDERE